MGRGGGSCVGDTAALQGGFYSFPPQPRVGTEVRSPPHVLGFWTPNTAVPPDASLGLRCRPSRAVREAAHRKGPGQAPRSGSRLRSRGTGRLPGGSQAGQAAQACAGTGDQNWELDPNSSRPRRGHRTRSHRSQGMVCTGQHVRGSGWAEGACAHTCTDARDTTQQQG